MKTAQVAPIELAFDMGFDSALDAVLEIINRIKQPYVVTGDIDNIVMFNKLIAEIKKLKEE